MEPAHDDPIATSAAPHYHHVDGRDPCREWETLLVQRSALSTIAGLIRYNAHANGSRAPRSRRTKAPNGRRGDLVTVNCLYRGDSLTDGMGAARYMAGTRPIGSPGSAGQEWPAHAALVFFGA